MHHMLGIIEFWDIIFIFVFILPSAYPFLSPLCPFLTQFRPWPNLERRNKEIFYSTLIYGFRFCQLPSQYLIDFRLQIIQGEDIFNIFDPVIRQIIHFFRTIRSCLLFAFLKISDRDRLLTWERNWVFVTSSNFLILISWQSNSENLLYFKLRSLELTQFIVWNI